MSGDSRSGGENPAAAGNVSDWEDLEQRMADRIDTALNQRMDVMGSALNQRIDAVVDKLSSVLQDASGGNRSESGGRGSAAAGGNQFAPGVQSGTPGGAEMSSISGRPPTAVDSVGSQERSLEVGGVDSPGGEIASSVGGGGDLSGAAVYNSLAKQLPRVQPPAFKGDRKEYLPFRADFMRTAALLELKGQFVGPQRVTDISKDSSELLSEGFTMEQISAGRNAWNLISTALQSNHAKSIIRQCANAKMALTELDAVYSPDTQGAKQELFRRFNRCTFSGNDDPIRALNDLELIWGQLNDKDGVELDMSFLLTKFIDILPTPEYEAAQNSLSAMPGPTRNDVVRIVTTQREKLIRLGDEEKRGGQRKGAEQAYVTATSGNGGGGKKGGGNGGGRGGGGGGKRGSGGGGGEKKKGRCYRCNWKGHFAEDCTTKREDFLPKCENCEGYGHKKEKCTSSEQERKVEEAVLAEVVTYESDHDSVNDQSF